MQLDGKGNGTSYNLMKQFDNIMRTTFGEKVELVSYYGPVQMCVFGLEYKYLPLGYTIKAECERGVITLGVINQEGEMFQPSMVYPQARYYHFADVANDVKQLVELTFKAINSNEIVFMNMQEK